MKKSLLVFVILTLISTLEVKSQTLEGSQWNTHWAAPINDSINFNFKNDTLFITNLSGAEMITTSFVESNDTMWVKDISGPYSCSPTDEGIFKFSITDGVLNFTTISDVCAGRASFVTSNSLKRKTLSAKSILKLRESIKVYPNPATTQTIIEWGENLTISKIEITNVYGQLVYAAIDLQNSFQHIDCSHWDAGIHLITMYSLQGNLSQKIMIK
ncbi:MAG: hypothetical protein COA58_12585 [Bacteroidetes bacterium]|nr:MAG: hypothetical protein COA58_12585 [Bacteroidota bacterium]